MLRPELKKRSDLSPEAQKVLGLIEDPYVAGTVGLGQEFKNVGMADYFKGISQHPEMVHPKSFADMPTAAGQIVRVPMGKLREEVTLYQEMVKRQPANAEMAAHLAKLEDALRVAHDRVGEIPKDFVALPDTWEYGTLRGAYVSKVIARDVLSLFEFSSVQSEHLLGRGMALTLKGLRSGMTFFKASKTAFSIPTYFRNTGSNMWQLALAGMPVHQIPLYVKSALGELIAGGKDATMAKRKGLFRGNFSVGEQRHALQDIASLNPRSHLTEVINVVQKIGKYYGKIDDVSKLAMYKYLRESGKTIDEAIAGAAEAGMDYSLVHPAIRAARSYYVPFATYMYKLPPLLAQSYKQPWVFAAGLALPTVIAKGVKEYNNLTDEEYRKIATQLPIFMRRSKSFALLPWKDAQGNWGWVDIQYWLPWGNYQQAIADLKYGEPGGLMSDFGILGNPYFQMAMTAKSSINDKPPINPFTGIPLYNQLDSPNEKLMAWIEYTYGQWMPTMLTRYGALGRTVRSIEGTPDRYGRAPSKTEAALRWAGVNVIHPTPQQIAKERAYLMKQAEIDLRRIFNDPTALKEKKIQARDAFRERVRYILGQPQPKTTP